MNTAYSLESECGILDFSQKEVVFKHVHFWEDLKCRGWGEEKCG